MHIISDFDGVIGHTGPLNWEIVSRLHPDVTREQYFIAHHLGNVFAEPAVPFTAVTSAEYFTEINRRLDRMQIKGAIPTIVHLGQRHRIHIVTSNCEVAIKRVLSEAGVLHHFGHILGQEAHASKVEKFQRIFAAEQITAADTLYVTDTVGDLKEAAKVGLRTIAVTFGYHPYALLSAHNPTRIAHSWPEVQAHAEELLA